MSNVNIVDYLKDDVWLEEDTYLRKKSVFSGYDVNIAFGALYETIREELGEALDGNSYIWNFLHFLTDRSITAGRGCSLTHDDWVSMLTVEYIVDTYSLRDWASVELILDGQSAGDEQCLDEMEYLGYHLDELLKQRSLPLADPEGVPFESTKWHDDLVAPIRRAMARIQELESAGVDVIDQYEQTEPLI